MFIILNDNNDKMDNKGVQNAQYDSQSLRPSCRSQPLFHSKGTSRPGPRPFKDPDQ